MDKSLENLTWGTDAGFYRLLPREVIHPTNNEDVIAIMKRAERENRHITFRAAGTSLSGQAITDDLLVVVGKKWEGYKILDNGERISLQPGIIGERVNQILAKQGRMFGPDPASIKSAMVGGIVMNNASGMSCGITANSLQLLDSATLIFADGTILNTGNADSCAAFRKSHSAFISEIEHLRDSIRQNPALCARIKKKYSIKNVVGLTISPFLNYDNPFDIIAHLLVGSEGTLAFLSEVTMRTLPKPKFQASALLYFPDSDSACRAVQALAHIGTDAAEMFDYQALKSMKNDVEQFEELPHETTALLIRTVSTNHDALEQQIAQLSALLNDFTPLRPYTFTEDATIYNRYWAIRSGIFPAVGAMRPIGTTCLIEDVAFPMEHLPEATRELRALLDQSGYTDAVIYGHALAGNYHFILNQSFETQTDIDRYEALMQGVVKMVVERYDGSLKAEHGTGRNMAPFVEKEWGAEAYAVMCAVKQLFDPKQRLNPGVIFNDDARCYLKNIKPLPKLHPLVDRCIECGFCEVNCVSCGFTLSARQRIVALREMAHLRATGTDNRRLKALEEQFSYQGNATCAGDGLCATSCPVKINTGEMIHVVRAMNLEKKRTARAIGIWCGHHLSSIETTLRVALNGVNAVHSLIGTPAMRSIGKALYSVGGHNIPLWTAQLPKGAKKAEPSIQSERKVVYFPSCINQTMGVQSRNHKTMPLMKKMVALLEKAGYEVIFPKEMSKLCCGTIWESKGMEDEANHKSTELEAALLEASEQGRYPVMCDQSPCLYRMRKTIKGVELYEPVEFILHYLTPYLEFTPIDEVISVHTTCSMTKMGLQDSLLTLAKMCSTNVVVPEGVGCCGFAGDKGFTHPELNQWALRKLKTELEKAGVQHGYSNSRTCEIGLTTHGGVTYENIVYLVDQVTQVKDLHHKQ